MLKNDVTMTIRPQLDSKTIPAGTDLNALAERIAALTERYGRAPLKDEEPAAEAEAETENL